MIARLQLWLLAGQVLLGAGLAIWLAGTGRSSIGAAVAIGIVAPIALHAVVLTADFAIAWMVRGARPHDEPQHGFMRGLRAWMVAWAREIVDSIRTFSFSQPLLARRAFAVGAAHDQRLPVLLIHGYFCNRALWRPMAARLVAGGHAVDERDVDPEILHRRVEKLLHRNRQSVDLVDEQHRALGGVGEIGQQILGGSQGRAAGDLERGAEFPRDAGRERRLAEAGRPVEEDVAERLAPLPRRVDRDHEPLVHGPLADHLLHPLRPQRAVFRRGVVRRGTLNAGLAEGFHAVHRFTA